MKAGLSIVQHIGCSMANHTYTCI